MAQPSKVIPFKAPPKPAGSVTLCCSPCLQAGVVADAKYRERPSIPARRFLCSAHALEIGLHQVEKIEKISTLDGGIETPEVRTQKGHHQPMPLCSECQTKRLSHLNTRGVCIECQTRTRSGSGKMCRRCGDHFVRRNNASNLCRKCRSAARRLDPEQRAKCRLCKITRLSRHNRSGVCLGCRPFRQKPRPPAQPQRRRRSRAKRRNVRRTK